MPLLIMSTKLFRTVVRLRGESGPAMPGTTVLGLTKKQAPRGRLLIVLAVAVMIIVAVTFLSEAYLA